MTYTTTQGDMWDGISFKAYGSEKHMAALIAANPVHGGTFIFPAGVVLKLPEIDMAAAVPDTMPPWKRVTSS